MLISSIVGIIFSQVEEIKYINKKLSGISITNIIYIIGFILVPVFAYLIILDKDSQILGSVLSIVGLVVLAYVGYIIFDYKVVKKDHQSGDRLIALMILAVFCTIFWACFEQAGSSITVWVDKCVNLVGMNASQTNAINPAYIVLLAIPFSWMWTKLGFMNKNPNTPMKFALGIFQLGLGFLIFAATAHFIGDNGKIPFLFVFLGYFLITTGELFLSPIGLSKVTELSPKRIAAFMMGVWFLSSTFAHYISGEIAKLTTSGISGESNWLSDLTNWFMGYPDQSNEAIATLLQYNSIYGQIGFVTIFISIFVVIISPFIKKLMHGLH
jgi:POT family proton-dependent oligopeptide transporter